MSAPAKTPALPRDDSILAKRGDVDAFRAALRDWLKRNVPQDWEQRLARDYEHEYPRIQRDWLAKLESIGLAVPHWPKQWGGEDLSIRHQVAIYEEFARANAPALLMYSISHSHVPGTLYSWGTPAQIERYVPAARHGEVWAQGFSEPNAGSDLASLRTRAERVKDPTGRGGGDRYIVNGQKIWSSGAMHASLYMLLARTDPKSAKHNGISMMIVDLKAKGVTLRPIRQINGNAEFCEVFLDDVEVPVENLIGPENQGWKVAQSTLSTERGLLIFNNSERAQMLCERVLARIRSGSEAWFEDDQWRREFIQAYTELQSLRAMIRRMLDNVERTGEVGDTPPLIKLHYSELQQRLTELLLRVGGVAEQRLEDVKIPGNFPKGSPYNDYLSSWIWTISGGSSEIIRNIISERMLGLPKEPRLPG
jgi:alkylation response protein AidB-like acyl-CoA dehydrogenase